MASTDMYPVLGLGIVNPPLPFVPWQGSGFPTPISYPNLVAWYQASDFDNIGDTQEVAYWLNSGSSPAVNLTLYALGNPGNRPKVARNSINSTMTSLSNTGLRGLKTQFATAFLTSKNIWTWFGVVKFTTHAAENDAMGLTVGASEYRLAINSNGQLNLVYGNVGSYNSQGSFSLNDWHYVIIVDNNDTETATIDGNTVSWQSQPGTPQSNPTDICVFEGNTTNQFTGSVAEVGVFDRALSASELSGMYAYFQTRYGLT